MSTFYYFYSSFRSFEIKFLSLPALNSLIVMKSRYCNEEGTLILQWEGRPQAICLFVKRRLLFIRLTYTFWNYKEEVCNLTIWFSLVLTEMVQWVSSGQFSLCQKIFRLAVLQEDTEMGVVILPVCIVPLNTEKNVLPYALASFHCRLFEYGSFSFSTRHMHTLQKSRGSVVILTCTEVIRGSDWGQNAQVREGRRGMWVCIKCLWTASIWLLAIASQASPSYFFYLPQ